MKRKNGFTIIEILLSLGIILLISTISVVTFSVVSNKDKSQLNAITEKIILAAKLYINNEHDENGDVYINGISAGGKGLIIPLENLYKEGYVNESDYNYVVKNINNPKRYVIVGYLEESDCQTGAININVNWNDRELVTSSLYLCSSTKTTPSNKTDMLSILLRDNELNLGIPDLSNYQDEDKGLYILPDDDGSSFYFYGKVKNNYLKFNDMMWRIVRINGNGSIRIALDDVIPYPLQRGTIVTKSYGTSYVNPIDGQFYETYDKEIRCFDTNGSSWGMTCFYDYNEEQQTMSNSSPYILKIPQNYNVLANKQGTTSLFEENYPDSLYQSQKYRILKNFIDDLSDISKIKTDDTYYINDDYLYNKRSFEFEDSKYNSRDFHKGIQTISYKELKYSGSANSYLSDINKSFYTSDYRSNGNYYYYNANESTISTERDSLVSRRCLYYKCRFTYTLQYPDGSDIAYTDAYRLLYLHGFKPVVNLLKDTCFKGDGTQDNPYEITAC